MSTTVDSVIADYSVSAMKIGSCYVYVHVSINKITNGDLPKPLTFVSTVRLTDFIHDWTDYVIEDILTYGPVPWENDETLDAVRYFYSEDDSIVVDGYLIRDVERVIEDFISAASIKAQDAYWDSLHRSLGITR